MLKTEMPEPETTAEQWQRCSVWALLPLLVKTVVQWAGVILGGAYLSFSERFQHYAPYALTALALLIIGSAVLNWRSTLFRVSAKGIELSRGVLQKEHLLLAKSRVQELQVQQPFYFRPLQLFTVSLDSAGSQQQEFYLTGLTASQLTLLQGSAQASHHSPSTAFFRLWLATLYNKHLWLPLMAVCGAVLSQLDGQVGEQLMAQGGEMLQQAGLEQSLTVQLAVSFALLLLVALVLVLMSWIWLYPQHFLRDDTQLQLIQGSLLKRSQRILKKRVQLLRLNQPWLARIFGHFSVIFHGFTNSQEQSSKFVVLGQGIDEVNQQLEAQQLLTLSELQQLAWQRFTPVYFRRLLWLRGGVILLLSLLIALLVKTQLIAPGTGCSLAGMAALWLLADWWAYRRWHGFYVQDQVLYLWQGGISQCWQILPLWQVQKVQLVQSLFLRKQQLVQLRFDTANGSITLAAIPNQQARELYAQVLSWRHSIAHGLPDASTRITARS